MFKHTVALIEAPNGDKRFLGMINVEVFNDEGVYCEYVIDGDVIEWQSDRSTADMDKIAFDVADAFEKSR